MRGQFQIQTGRGAVSDDEAAGERNPTVAAIGITETLTRAQTKANMRARFNN